MLTFLVTGARAPAAVEFALNLKRHGHRVYMADSLSYALGRHVSTLDGFFSIPSPRFNPEAFKQSLISILVANKIDYLIPACEEIFTVAYFKNELSDYTEVFCPELSLLNACHSKHKIMTLASECGAILPDTKPFLSMPESSFDSNVLKKEFSRFGNEVWCQLSERELEHKLASGDSYLIQQKIKGVEFCSYAIAKNGECLTQVVYQPLHRLKHSASLYFKPVNNPAILNIVASFVKKHHYTGQIGFDFIVNEAGTYLIECNPRMNSGVHLLSHLDLASVVNGKIIFPSATLKPKMLPYAMWLVVFPRALLTGKILEWIRDYRSADKACGVDSFRMSYRQYAVFIELLVLMLRHKVSFRTAMTIDIAWHGEPSK